MGLKRTVVFGCDHRGVELLNRLMDDLAVSPWKDDLILVEGLIPAGDPVDSVDYPNVSRAVVGTMAIWSNSFGVLICGSGHGVNIAANRLKGIRSVTCRTREDAIMARNHNNANVIALGADVTPYKDARWILRSFISTEFDGGERHIRRIKLIDGDR